MTENGEKAGRSTRGVRIALIVSLCLNVLVVGAVAGVGVYWARFGGVSVERFASPAGLGGVVGALDRRDRLRMREDIGGMREQIDWHRARASANLEDLVAILQADEFDRIALESLFADQRNLLLVRMEQGHGLLVERIDALTPEQRRQYADRLGNRYRKGKGTRHHK